MKPLLLLIFVTIFNLTSFADTTYVYQLPFEEKFTTGFFTTNEWTVEGMNWMISGQQGNPLPSAMFTFTPADANYSKSLISQPMNGTGFISGRIFLDYDIKLDDEIASGQEKLSAEVFDGTEWITVYTDSSDGDFTWKRNHINITEAAKGDTFQIRFRSYGVNTADINYWLIDNINVYRLCEAPTNLAVRYLDPVNNPNLLQLTWESPDIPYNITEWISYDDSTNFTGIGIGVDATWGAAVHFTPQQLAEYSGTSLTKIRFIPVDAANTSFILKVWTGANGNTLVVSQPVSSIVYDTWNEYTLETPVPIDETTDLWFGYELTQSGGEYPAGCDNGPAVDGFGNMVNLDGVWESLYSLNSDLNYNWNIQGWIESDILTDDTIDLQGYNIYFKDEWLAFATESGYQHTIPNGNELICYEVSAVYLDCESEFSNEDCIVVSTNDIGLNKINIFPNPASNKVEFELDDEIRQIVIYNLLGEAISVMDVSQLQQRFHLDLTTYRSGVYLVKFISSSGESLTKKMIITK